ncbi:YigZ family protein [Periweissella cryptocerci]|uniref:YigZ family protein n=1 Tax=Periweissella cryptocerci TaxID=2506420 RepID=A0A4P6YT51_9LACO|nr:YigZ family protein [Periweissella cryptocerci]QBO35914.1 YigZ family protein [Periweissella cryptocerci]
MPTYLSISHDFQHEIVIKKSRFITNLKRVHSEDEAVAFINAIKKEHYKANHNTSAFVLGDRDEIQRASDDGEPSGTAGVPILEVLKRNEVHDVVAVVTRYFGGIKLGAGGLIRAYAGSAAEALAEVGLIQRVVMTTMDLTLEYPQFDTLNHWLSQNNYQTPVVNYTDKVNLTLPIETADIAHFTNSITELLNGRVVISVGDESFQEIPYEPNQEDA